MDSSGQGRTYLSGLAVYGVSDNGIYGESNEFEFRATAYSGYTSLGSSTLRIEGVDPNFTSQTMHSLVIVKAPTNGAVVKVDVVETDGWPNPDDNFDLVQYQPTPAVFDRIELTQYNKNTWWPLKEQPYIGAFDPEKVSPRFTW